MKRRVFFRISLVLALAFSTHAARAESTETPLAERLGHIREQTSGLEQNLVEGLRSQKTARANIKKIKTLLKLQEQEKDLGNRRLEELERTIAELEVRRGQLREKVLIQQRSVRNSLREIHRSSGEVPRTPQLHLRERIEAPRRRVLAAMVDRSVKEIEAYRVDLADADQLGVRIQDEKQQLTYLFQDLKEREGILELNQRLQGDLVSKRSGERVKQLETYHHLKSAEVQVERMIHDFNARMELQDAIDTERKLTRTQLAQQAENQKMMQSAFAQMKGRLSLPASGRIISQFGQVLDPRTQLHIFKKGVDIQAGSKQPVRAVGAGKIAFSGEMPGFGRIAIVDHGDHFYTLCGNLGSLTKKAGEAIRAGETLGVTDESGTPVYFEIRARNIAVNPLQWVSNSSTIN